MATKYLQKCVWLNCSSTKERKRSLENKGGSEREVTIPRQSTRKGQNRRGHPSLGWGPDLTGKVGEVPGGAVSSGGWGERPVRRYPAMELAGNQCVSMVWWGAPSTGPRGHLQGWIWLGGPHHSDCFLREAQDKAGASLEAGTSCAFLQCPLVGPLSSLSHTAEHPASWQGRRGPVSQAGQWRVYLDLRDNKWTTGPRNLGKEGRHGRPFSGTSPSTSAQ